MKDELHQPLGRSRHEKTRETPADGRGRRLAPWIAFIVLGGLGAGLYVSTVRDPLLATLGGRPYAIAKIDPYQPPPPEPTPAPQQQLTQAPAQSWERDHIVTVGDIEQLSGVKVTRNGPSGPGPIIIQVQPESSGVRLAPAPDHRIAEKGRYGTLPRISPDGARPMDIYSRPFVPSPRLKPNAPRIALIIGGVGLNPQTTEAAINELPETVTLAFAPYGPGLEVAVARARTRGHEVLLQTPMEPFDYPQNNPGPHTLLVESAGDLDDLHWLLSRFSGYAGVMNFLGGRLTADEKALTPVLADIAKRGLFFIDDGASPRSLIAATAGQLSLPQSRVDVILDSGSAPQSIDAALAQLEAQSLQNGAAIGFANAQTQTISRLARFAREAERRGFAMAPASAIVARSGHPAVISGVSK